MWSLKPGSRWKCLEKQKSAIRLDAGFFIIFAFGCVYSLVLLGNFIQITAFVILLNLFETEYLNAFFRNIQLLFSVIFSKSFFWVWLYFIGGKVSSLHHTNNINIMYYFTADFTMSYAARRFSSVAAIRCHINCRNYYH